MCEVSAEYSMIAVIAVPDDKGEELILAALEYKPGPAPRVVAKAVGELAEQIKNIIAAEHIIIGNTALAQELYNGVDVCEEIPPSLYKSVANILADAFRVKRK